MSLKKIFAAIAAAALSVASATASDGPSFVEQVLSIEPMNGKAVNPDAQYYIFLYSASWCAPCRQEMPGIVEKYENLRDSGVEIILSDCSGTLEAAQKYQEAFKINFPAYIDPSMARGSSEERIPALKDVKVQAVPCMLIFNRDGKLLSKVNPARIKPDLLTYIRQKEADLNNK